MEKRGQTLSPTSPKSDLSRINREGYELRHKQVNSVKWKLGQGVGWGIPRRKTKPNGPENKKTRPSQGPYNS